MVAFNGVLQLCIYNNVVEQDTRNIRNTTIYGLQTNTTTIDLSTEAT